MLYQLLIICALISLTVGQSCQSYFKYVRGYSGDTEGLLAIPLTAVPEHDLRVIFIIGAQLPTTYVGELSLLKGTQNSIEDLKNRIPVQYRVKFPLTNPLPKIMEISHNGLTICQGEREYNQYSYTTTITLSHKLRTNLVFDQSIYTQPLPPFQENPFTRPPNSYEIDHYTTFIPQTTRRPYTLPRTPQYQHTTRKPYQPPPIPSNFNNRGSENVCGTRDFNDEVTSLVVNGHSAKIEQFPWLVAHFNAHIGFMCGGSIVSTKIIVTAAHCIRDKRTKNNISVQDSSYYLGRYSLTSSSESGYVQAYVDSFIVHPMWKPFDKAYDSDIALSVLQNSITFSDKIKPICLWTGKGYNDIIGKKGYIAGWGLTENKMTSDIPQFVNLPVVEESVCLRSHHSFREITSDKTFCVGDKSGSTLCNGDSGGGFVVKHGNLFYLRGIVSAGVQDDDHECSKTEYVLFTDVSLFTSWINYYINKY